MIGPSTLFAGPHDVLCPYRPRYKIRWSINSACKNVGFRPVETANPGVNATSDAQIIENNRGRFALQEQSHSEHATSPVKMRVRAKMRQKKNSFFALKKSPSY